MLALQNLQTLAITYQRLIQTGRRKNQTPYHEVFQRRCLSEFRKVLADDRQSLYKNFV